MSSSNQDVPSFSVSPRARDYLLYSEFLGSIEHSGSIETVGYSELDYVQSYKFNSHGYRSPEFSSGVYLLCSGDSNTFGVGLPEYAIWPSIVTKNINIDSYVNLAIPGSSVHSVVIDILHYLRQYSQPKKIVVIFPDFTRFLLYSDATALVSRNRPNGFGPTNAQISGHLGNQAKYSKKPHEIEQIVTREHCQMLSIQMIHILEDICDVLEIELHWSIWDSIDDIDLIVDLKSKNSKYFRHFFDIGAKNWSRDLVSGRMNFSNDSELVDCHTDLFYENKEIFNFATDKYPHHDGAHRHAHAAEIIESIFTRKEAQ